MIPTVIYVPTTALVAADSNESRWMNSSNHSTSTATDRPTRKPSSIDIPNAPASTPAEASEMSRWMNSSLRSAELMLSPRNARTTATRRANIVSQRNRIQWNSYRSLNYSHRSESDSAPAFPLRKTSTLNLQA